MRTTLAIGGSTVGAALSAALGGRTVTALAGDPKAPWLLGRSAGITAYLLLVLLTATGLVLAHPAAARLHRPHPVTRVRLHSWLAAFTLVFVALHVVALATDRYAHVGWAGALLPLASAYRPLPVTFGMLGLWSGLAAGVTAALAGRGAGRWWWRVHHVAAASLVLVWVHAVLAGSDTGALLALYVVTGAAVAALGAARHTARLTARRARFRRTATA